MQTLLKMSFANVLNLVMRAKFGSDQVEIVKNMVDYNISFEQLCAILCFVTHGSDKIDIIKHCANEMKVEPLHSDVWIKGMKNVCEKIVYGCDKVAALNAMRQVAKKQKRADCVDVADLLGTIVHGNDKLDALKIVVSMFGTDMIGDKTHILNKFVHESDRETAAILLNTTYNKKKSSGVTNLYSIGSTICQTNDGCYINGVLFNKGPVLGSVSVVNGVVTVDGCEYVLQNGEWVLKNNTGQQTQYSATNTDRISRYYVGDNSDDDNSSSNGSSKDSSSDTEKEVEQVSTTTPFVRGNDQCHAFAQRFNVLAPLASLLELEGVTVETKIEENQCAVCFENKKDIVFIPCNHQCCCIDCARNLFEKPICPLCKSEIKSAIKVFS